MAAPPPATPSTGAPADGSWWATAPAPTPPPVDPEAIRAVPETVTPTPPPLPPASPALALPILDVEPAERVTPELVLEPPARRFQPWAIGLAAAGFLLVAGLLAWWAIPSRRQLVNTNDTQLAQADADREQTTPESTGDSAREDERPSVPPFIPQEKNPPPEIVGIEPIPDPVRPRVEVEDPPVRNPDPPKPEVKPEPKPEPARLVLKRRRDLSEEDLRRQIEKVTEVALDRSADRADTANMIAQGRTAFQQGKQNEVGPLVMKSRPDLAGLPLQMGDKCKLSPSLADHLQAGSVSLRAHLKGAAMKRSVNDGDFRPDARSLNQALSGDGDRHNKWLKTEAIPALQQLLMAENESIRDVLAEQLARIEGKKATQALAQRALFDLHPEVRKHALEALLKRPKDEYVSYVLDAFRHPWPMIADHAAEALVALQVSEAVPRLVRLLDEPNPSLAFRKPGTETWYVKDMVKINHFRNCLMCHPASFDPQDKVRGPVPRTDRPLDAVSVYGMQADVFVRADITYLRQDFSCPLPVAHHGPWPAVQRFDFVVRERLAQPPEIQKAQAATSATSASEYQRAIFFALRELTGTDAGPSPEDWKRLFLQKAGAPEKLSASLRQAGGIAVDGAGNVLISDVGNKLILRQEDNRWTPAWKMAAGAEALAVDGKGRLIACMPAQGQIVALEPGSNEPRVLAGQMKGRKLHGPASLALDRLGGIYFTDLAASVLPSDHGALYYLSSQGNVTVLPCDVVRPMGVALSPDEKTLYVTGAGTLDVRAYPLEAAGLPGKGKTLCKLDMTVEGMPIQGAGLATDRDGNLYAAHPGRKCVQVFNREGARLGTVGLPDAPSHCTVTADETRALLVTTPSAAYRVKLDR
jgi:sugar lactone lactonase YvrE